MVCHWRDYCDRVVSVGVSDLHRAWANNDCSVRKVKWVLCLVEDGIGGAMTQGQFFTNPKSLLIDQDIFMDWTRLRSPLCPSLFTPARSAQTPFTLGFDLVQLCVPPRAAR